MVVENTLVWQAGDEEKGGRVSRRDIFVAEDAPSSSTAARPPMPDRRRSRSSRRSIDPSAALPIQYRTLSQDIDDAERQRQSDQAKAKDAMVLKFETIDWHKITSKELETRLETSVVGGLSAASASERLRTHGANAISPLPNPWFGKVMGYFFKGFGSILAVGGVLVFLSWKPLGNPAPAVANLALGIVLIAVFLIQAAFNAWQDWSSSRVMQSITAMLPESCHVIREGAQAEISASALVPGDVLLLKAGDRIPADVRYVRVSHDMTVDRAVLTGESKPIKASAESSTENDATANYLETHCIGLQGTHCVSGTARGVVVATGDATVFGQIAKLTGTSKTSLTTIEREILRFVLLIFAIMVTWIVVLAAVWGGWLRKAYPDWISVPMLIVSCVSVAIAYIPEGLPIATTASLTITANLMKKHKILCKSLKTVETLGAVSVICSDKTGTLTKNKMFVTDCSLGVTTYTANDARAALLVAPSANLSPMHQLRAGAGLCNAAEFDAEMLHYPLAERRIFGDATDQAALRLSESLGPVSQLRSAWTTVYELAFDSKNKFMARVFALNDTGNSVQNEATAALCLGPDEVAAGGVSKTSLPAAQQSTLLLVKGAPDILLDRCTRTVQASFGSVVDLTPATRQAVRQLKDQWSAQGRRVILVARKVLPPGLVVASAAPPAELDERVNSELQSDLTLVGLLALIDPPRDEIRGVMHTLRGAGIRTFMVTGDFGLTALAIARQCGMVLEPTVHNISHLARFPSKTERSPAGDGNRNSNRDSISNDDEEKRGVLMKWKSKLYIPFSSTSTARSSPAMASPLEPPQAALLLTGADLMKINDHQWDQICAYPEIVFARTTPDQKLRIVRAFQARDAVVAMTGDGVNDAPALKAADVGIGLAGGSDIAVEAADMVLLDESTFAAVVEAVRYGRLVFDNLKKIIAYLLPAGSWSEFWPVFTNVVLGLPQILSSFLMIIICCFTDCIAAIVLAYETPEADLLLRPPRNPRTTRLVNWQLMFQAYAFVGMVEVTLSFTMAYWYLQRNGVPFGELWFKFGDYSPAFLASVGGLDALNARINEASSIYFISLVVLQWFNLMAVRTRRLSLFQHPPAFNKATQNLLLFPAIVLSLGIAVIWLYIPQLQVVLGTSGVPAEHYFLPGALGLGLLGLDEARKAAVRRWPTGLLAKMAW